MTAARELRPVGELLRGELARLLRLAVASPHRAQEYALGLLAELELEPDAGVLEILEALRRDEPDVAELVARAWELRTGRPLDPAERPAVVARLRLTP